jgi:hypothetical protein
MFRLHIDVPLGTDETYAVGIANQIMKALKHGLSETEPFAYSKMPEIQYRLGNDGDRSPRNYLVKNENGHATTGKCRL